MKITASMVYDGLVSRYACEVGPLYIPDLAVGKVLCASPSTASGTDGIMFVENAGDTSGSLRIRSIDSVVVTCSAADDFPKGPYTFLLKTDESPSEVRNKILAIIDDYQGWADEVLGLVLHDYGIEDLLECAHKLFGNPITIVDDGLRLLANTTDDEMEDHLWTTLTGTEYLDIWNEEREGTRQFVEDLSEKGCLFDYPTSNQKRLAACIACRNGDKFAAVCVVRKNREITLGDFACLSYFANVLGMYLKTIPDYSADDRSSFDTFVIDALDGKVVDDEKFRNRLRMSGIELKTLMRIAVVSPRRGTMSNGQVMLVKKMLSREIWLGKPIVYDGRIVVLFNHDEGESPTRSDEKNIEKILNNRRLIMGVSSETRSPSLILPMYEQACYALDISRRVASDGPIVFFEDFRRFYLYELCVRNGNWRFFIHPCIIALADMAEKGDPVLGETLHSLVAHSGNKSATAEELCIQRNTLQYRINKIEKLCSVNLEDPDQFSHISQSYELLDYMGIGIADLPGEFTGGTGK
ncbi:MAG: PucR family transcriptional regulator [Coriobacteriales bacterium]|jgi:sugar diacid utilization regulator